MMKLFVKILNVKENKVYLTILLVISIAIVAMLGVESKNKENTGIVINGVKLAAYAEKGKIGVYIDGEVVSPGHIRVKEGTTLENAISEVGGVTKEADVQNIDTKKILKDGEKIIIPKAVSAYQYDNMLQINKEKININKADIDTLVKLDGIGRKTAENIISYRQNKKFENIEEIMKVEGIGQVKFQKIKDEICI